MIYSYPLWGVIHGVTIPLLDPSAHDEEEPNYDEEAQVWAAAMEHAMEVEDEETPDEYDWQISRLVSAATYTAEPDAGRVTTGRMKSRDKSCDLRHLQTLGRIGSNKISYGGLRHNDIIDAPRSGKRTGSRVRLS